MIKRIITLILIGLLTTGSVAYQDVTPIRNHYLEKTTLTKQEVYWIYTLKTRFWSDGTKIVVYYLDFDHPIHRAFVIDVLRTTPNNFQTSVETYINAGNASYFRKAESETEMYRRVAGTVGSVGYISSKILLINSGDNRVKEITIVD